MYPPLGSEMRGGLREQAPTVSAVVTPRPPVDTSNGIPTLAVEDSHLPSRLSSQGYAGTSPVESPTPPPMEVGRSRPPILDVERSDSWKLKGGGKGSVRKWQHFETNSNSPGNRTETSPASSTPQGHSGSSECNQNPGNAGCGNSNGASSGGLSGANGGHGGNIPITDGVTKVDMRGHEGGFEQENEEGEEEDKDSAQRILIGWMQARQRVFATLISVGCATVTFVEYLKGDVSSTLGTAVTLIPITVQLLLLRDILVRREERHILSKMHLDEQSRRDQSTGQINTSAALLKGTSGMGGAVEAGQGQGGCTAGSTDTGGGLPWVGGSVNGGANNKRTLRSSNSIGSSESLSSNTPPDSGRASGSRRSGSDITHGSQGSSNDEYPPNAIGRSSPGDNLTHFLETPFQKSVRILGSVSDSVNDPVLRSQLQRVVKLLSDPDSLHIVNGGAIRRVTMDVGTRSYIENVLQTPVKVASESRNWRKLRTGMFVVRALAKEVAKQAIYPSSGGKTSEHKGLADATGNPGEHLAYINSTRNQTELDDLLDDMSKRDGGAEGPGDPRRQSTGLYAKSWEEDYNRTFDQLNRGIIQGQQLVAKIMSRGDVRRDPDRFSVRELRNLARDSKMPEKIMEHPAGEEPSSEEKNRSKMKGIPRLPILEEERMDEVAALMTDGGFLKWDFNVFALEERSEGHSLWFAAMSTFFHYNLVGAFGLSVERLSQLFLCVEATYCYDPKQPNFYHTHVHAADVTLTVAHFLSVDLISNTVRGTHGLALIMAAIMHDYRHPGVNNGFLVRALDPLALTYNDSSVLENFHAAESFKMMLDQTFDIFKGWKPEDIKFFRHTYVKCILATDLALSLEYISKFQVLSSNAALRDASNSSARSGTKNAANGNAKPTTEGSQSQILLLQMVLKVADVSHPCKPWEIHNKWSELVTEEFFAQGDKELARGLSVSPLCDRRGQNLPKSQCDFIDFIVRPCVAIFSRYCNVTTWDNQLESNFRAWRTLLEESGGRLRSPTAASKGRSLR